MLGDTLVLRMCLGGEPTFRELLRRVKEVTFGAYVHQNLPFEMLVEKLQPGRGAIGAQSDVPGLISAVQRIPAVDGRQVSPHNLLRKSSAPARCST